MSWSNISSSSSKTWENTSTKSDSQSWSNISSSSSKTWENISTKSGSQSWLNNTSSSNYQSWENESKFEESPTWINTASKTHDTIQPWVNEAKVASFIKNDIESLGGTPMILHPCGSLQPTNLTDAIIATVVSTAAVVGGVALIVLSYGAATPGVSVAWGAIGSTSLGVGFAGTINAGVGIHSKRFCWEKWGIDVGFAAGTSLITFPTCFFGGQAVTGALIQGAKLSVNTSKFVAVAVGSLVGSGIHEGSCFVKCSIEGRDPEIIEIVLSGIGGMFEGGGAAYLGIRVYDPKKVLQVVEIKEYEQKIRILRGIHHDDHKGFGVQHMLKQRNNAEILGVSNELKPFAKELKRIMEKGPVGYQKIGGNNLKPVYMAKNGNLFSLGISREPCMINQMNPVSANKVQWIVNMCD